MFLRERMKFIKKYVKRNKGHYLLSQKDSWYPEFFFKYLKLHVMQQMQVKNLVLLSIKAFEKG